MHTGSQAGTLELTNLEAGFGPTQILQGLTLTLPARRITAIIGPSGCGKSTLLRCLNRMHELAPGAWTRGSVRLDGDDIYAPAQDPVLLRRRIGMVFQKPNPFPTMSIRENVLAGFRLTGAPPQDADRVVEQALQQCALWTEVKDKLNTPGTSLSGGQQQRLCIARTLAIAPEIILMDEPCSALDPVATARIEELMMVLRERYTIVIVTHNLQQAQRASDYTTFLLGGRLVEAGPTEAMFREARLRETRDYLAGKYG